jgi:hypothetical protein
LAVALVPEPAAGLLDGRPVELGNRRPRNADREGSAPLDPDRCRGRLEDHATILAAHREGHLRPETRLESDLHRNDDPTCRIDRRSHDAKCTTTVTAAQGAGTGNRKAGSSVSTGVRGALALVVALLGAAPAAAQQRAPALQAAVERLPVVARLDGGRTRFVLRGSLAPGRAAEMEALARAVIRDVQRRFVGTAGDGVARPPVDVCLFDDERAYVELAEVAWSGSDEPSMMGFYDPSDRLIVANLRRSVGNLRHEIVHPLLGDHFPELPAWLNEGLAALYGTSRPSGDRFEFLVNYRLRHVRAAIARRELPTLAEMAASSEADLYGPESGTYYGTARYLLLYLDSLGRLDDLYREMRAQGPTAEHQTALLTRMIDYAGFVAWTRTLRIGRTAPVPGR